MRFLNASLRTLCFEGVRAHEMRERTETRGLTQGVVQGVPVGKRMHARVDPQNGRGIGCEWFSHTLAGGTTLPHSQPNKLHSYTCAHL